MKLKRLLFTALTLTLVYLLILPASAASPLRTSGVFTYSVVDGKARIESCSPKAKGTVTVPAKIGGYPVTSISSYAFDNSFDARKNVTGVIISEGITKIGDHAFYNSNIKSVTIPRTVKVIPEGAFLGCKKLAKVKLSEGLTTISDRAFEGCEALTGITLPNTLTYIGASAFQSCRTLKSIRIPDQVTFMGKWAFLYCNALENVTIGASVTEMGEQIFSNCYKLKKVTIPSGISVIPRETFLYCSNLASVYIPSSVKTIKYGAFADTKLTTIYYGGTKAQWKKISVESLNKNITKPKRLTYVSPVKIKTQPKSVSVADGGKATVSVKASGSGLTYNWYYSSGTGYKKSSITSQTYSTTMKASAHGRKVFCIVKDKYGFSAKSKVVTLSVRTSLKITTQPKNTVALEKQNVKLTVKALGTDLSYAWYYAPWGTTKYTKASSTKNVFSVTMAKKWDKCKVYCVITDKYGNKVQTKSVRLSLPTAEQYCGENIFWQIDKNGTMTLTGTGAMYDYKMAADRPYNSHYYNVKKLVIGNGITHLGDLAFESFPDLTEVSLPSTLKTIGVMAFGSCGLKSITIPNSVTEIKRDAFSHCTDITSITIPTSVKKIGSYAFGSCTSIESFTVSSKNKYFSTDRYGALYNKDKTELHYVPAKITGVIVLPGTVKKILNATIAEAYYLKNIVYMGTQAQWKKLGFGSYSSKTIYYAVSNGTCGKKVKWNLNADGVLTISGTGPMDEYLDREKTWRPFPQAITAIVIKPGVTKISNQAFSGCDFLTSVSIPSTVKAIGSEAFFRCSKLKSVVIPKGVTVIERHTFSGCTSLTSVYIPVTVKTIESSAFGLCDKLTTVKYGGSSANWKKVKIHSNSNEALKKATIKYNVATPA